ncbi:MAG: copper-binding protein [Pseudomonadota bacterium]
MKTILKLAAAVLILSSNHVLAHDGDDHKKPAGHAAELGKPGNPAKVSRTVKVAMDDSMRFTPATIPVKRGETIKFVVTNNGKLKHEMVLGSIKELKDHAALMLKFPEMEHSDPNQVSVDSGKTGELIWQFTKSGAFDFACLQPGHFEAGMVGKVAVATTLAQAEKLVPATVSGSALSVAAASVSPPVESKTAADATLPMTDGEVKKVDKEAGKLTIKHGPIANLEMPPMTMVFRVKDPAMLDQVKAGDKIKFSVEKASGAMTVTRIESAK